MKIERLRAPFQYYGGKGLMVARLTPLVPSGGKPYCEPFCGGASLFFSRELAPVEVLNDLDRDVVNVFRCLQNKDTFEELRHRLMWTPYARAEFERAIETLKEPSADSVTRAWAFMVAQNQGFGGHADTVGNWGRAFVPDAGTAGTANRWLMRLSMLDAWRWRLMRVQIDCRDALEVIRYWDNHDAVFYCDPPYVQETRAKGWVNVYAHEMSEEQHRALVETLLSVSGAVVLSGYEHPVYWPLENAGWERAEFKTSCHAAARTRVSGILGKGAATADVPRTEIVWRNKRAVELTAAKSA